MKELKEIYERLEKLMIDKLPEYINRENKENLDDITLEQFNNTKIDENGLITLFLKLLCKKVLKMQRIE